MKEEEEIKSQRKEKNIKLGIDSNFDLQKFEKILRVKGEPIGLQNTGNTCYFNSLIQTLFRVNSFVKAVLTMPIQQTDPSADLLESEENSIVLKRRQKSLEMVRYLQFLFSDMIFSKKKYLNSKNVLDRVVDDQCNFVDVGNQEDLIEFFIKLNSRIEEISEISCKQLEGKKMTDELEESKIWLILEAMALMNPKKLKSIFYGKIKSTIVFGENEKSSGEEQFAPLIIPITPNELYASLEAVFVCELDNYKAENNQIYKKAQKMSWIDELPEVLVFQLSRVNYDVENRSLVKSNGYFKFDMTIYMDRFLYKNRKDINVMRLKSRELDLKIASIESTLASINNKMIELEAREPSPEKTKEQANLGKIFFMLAEDLEELFSLKEKYVAEKENMFGMYTGQPYHLFSIIIHEGTGQFGHYFVLIKIGKNWYKLSDRFVKPMKEEEVLELAYGGSQKTSACASCLFYTKDWFTDKDDESESPYQRYGEYVPAHFRKQLKEQNQIAAKLHNVKKKLFIGTCFN